MIPNIITGIRLFMVLPILTCAAKGKIDPQMFKVAALLFLIAVCTDGLDGFAARRLNMTSDFGAMFDLVTDRCLMTPTLLVMTARGAFAHTMFPISPVLYVIIIVGADIMTLFSIFVFTRLRKHDPTAVFPTPTRVVKLTYPAQALVVFLGLLAVNPKVVTVFMLVAACLTIAAVVSYIKKGGYVLKQGLPVLLNQFMAEFREDPPPAIPEKPQEQSEDDNK